MEGGSVGPEGTRREKEIRKKKNMLVDEGLGTEGGGKHQWWRKEKRRRRIGGGTTGCNAFKSRVSSVMTATLVSRSF